MHAQAACTCACACVCMCVCVVEERTIALIKTVLVPHVFLSTKCHTWRMMLGDGAIASHPLALQERAGHMHAFLHYSGASEIVSVCRRAARFDHAPTMRCFSCLGRTMGLRISVAN